MEKYFFEQTPRGTSLMLRLFYGDSNDPTHLNPLGYISIPIEDKELVSYLNKALATYHNDRAAAEGDHSPIDKLNRKELSGES